MLEGAGCLFGEFPQDFVVAVSKLYQGYFRNVTECPFDQVHQGIGEEQQGRIAGHLVNLAHVGAAQAALLHQDEADISGDVGAKDEEGSVEELRTPLQFDNAHNGHHPGNQLYENELETVRHNEPGVENCDKVHEQGQPGIEENPDDHRDNAHGDQVKITDVQPDHDAGRKHHHEDEQQDQEYFLVVGENVFPVNEEK
jgi:hypothetical protein